MNPRVIQPIDPNLVMSHQSFGGLCYINLMSNVLQLILPDVEEKLALFPEIYSYEVYEYKFLITIKVMVTMEDYSTALILRINEDMRYKLEDMYPELMIDFKILPWHPKPKKYKPILH